jgi:C-terminal processing protease CtpA/Prc
MSQYPVHGQLTIRPENFEQAYVFVKERVATISEPILKSMPVYEHIKYWSVDIEATCEQWQTLKGELNQFNISSIVDDYACQAQDDGTIVTYTRTGEAVRKRPIPFVLLIAAAFVFLFLPLMLAYRAYAAYIAANVENVGPKLYFNTAFDYIKLHALQRPADWETLRTEAWARTHNPQRYADVYPAVRFVLAQLKDNHSQFLAPEEAAQMQQGAEYGLGLIVDPLEHVVLWVGTGSPAERVGIRIGDVIETVNGQPLARDEAWHALYAYENTKTLIRVRPRDQNQSRFVWLQTMSYSYSGTPTAQHLGDNIGYLKLPSAFGNTAKDYANTAQSAIRTVDQTPTCGWIVDVRSNTGGSASAMLAAIGPLAGEGKLGASEREWVYRNGQFEYGGQVFEKTIGYRLKHPSSPVAVLTNRLTASAGEAVVVAFRGRPDTRSFGEPTNGIPTSNVGAVMSDGAWLIVTASSDTDRTGKSYDGKLLPDEFVKPDWALFDTLQDPVLRAAISWLKTQPACKQ